MPLRPRPEVEDLKVCPHGGPDRAELEALGLTPGEIIDFSVNCNPFPPPPGIRKILKSTPINCYPDPEANQLRRSLAEKLGVAPDNILPGNGAVELIRLIALTYFGHGDPVVVLEPTFGEYEVACQIAGAQVVKQRMRAEDSFQVDIEGTRGIIQEHRPRGIFVCNPNNPTGGYLPRHDIETILDSGDDFLLVLDEAFITFIEERWSSIDLISRGNVILVNSMTKDYGLAGLRLGYAIAHREIIGNLRRVCPPWNVNIMAQQAGIAALEAAEYFERCRQKIRLAKQYLMTELSHLGFTVLPSRVNFFLVQVGNARAFRSTLLRNGILVRDCTSFGLPEYVRIAARTMSQSRKLVAAIRALKQGGELDLGRIGY